METKSFNFGEQPITQLLEEHKLSNHDLVETSDELITHKMITKACKGRRLTPNIQNKVLRALNTKTSQEYQLKDLFNYGPHMRKIES